MAADYRPSAGEASATSAAEYARPESEEELRASRQEYGYEERRSWAEEFVESVGADGLYEVLEERTFDRASAATSVSHTRSTVRSLIEVKNGRARLRAAARSAPGNSPSR
jgi:hypothetical protein